MRLAPILAEHGVDLIDISSGGNSSVPQMDIGKDTAYQAHFSEAVKRAAGDKILVSAVGGIKTGAMAQEVLDKVCNIPTSCEERAVC